MSCESIKYSESTTSDKDCDSSLHIYILYSCRVGSVYGIHEK